MTANCENSTLLYLGAMYSTTAHNLSPPSLEDIARAIGPVLQNNYSEANVSVATCPDLREAPFHIAVGGLTGNECIADIGGQPNLFPRPRLEKKYSMLDCAKAMKMSPSGGALLGAGAAPYHVVGTNAEMAPNLSWETEFENVESASRVIRVAKSDKIVCEVSDSTQCALMMNLFGSKGDEGPVLKITARGRKSTQKSFVECIRTALQDTYGDKRQISLGGVFIVKRGKAVYHVMPDFPPQEDLPFRDRKAVEDWLTFHTFDSPIVGLAVFHSCDPEGLGLRMEHAHCFSADDANTGGHYHGDDGSDEVEYEGYFNTAKTLYRIDEPKNQGPDVV